jgi:hypothetical protein
MKMLLNPCNRLKVLDEKLFIQNQEKIFGWLLDRIRGEITFGGHFRYIHG